MTERTIILTEAEAHMMMNELARRDPVVGLLLTKLQALGPAEPAPPDGPRPGGIVMERDPQRAGRRA